MAATAYRYAGQFLAQAGALFDVQHKNMGMLELQVDSLVPGAKETLILALEDFKVPGRKVGTAALPYLNGNSQYPTRPEKMDVVEATFRDFPLLGVRAFLHQWFTFVYDEVTGFSTPTGLLKVNAFFVLFQSNATAERAALIEGMFPINEPENEITYENGEHMPLKVQFACDRVLWQNSLFNPQS